MDPVKLIPRWLRARAGEYLRKRGFGLQPLKLMKNEVWIDVGAHLGEGTIEVAMQNPKLLVFAFEPNWTLARQIMGLSANFAVLPMAVSDKDGSPISS